VEFEVLEHNLFSWVTNKSEFVINILAYLTEILSLMKLHVPIHQLILYSKCANKTVLTAFSFPMYLQQLYINLYIQTLMQNYWNIFTGCMC